MDQAKQAGAFYQVAIAVALCAGFHFIATAFVARPLIFHFGTLAAIYAVLYGLTWLSRNGYLRTANMLFVIGVFAFLAVSAFCNGGIRSPYFTCLILVAVFAGLQIDFNAGFIFAAMYVAAGVFLGVAELNGDLPSAILSRPSSSHLFATVTYPLGGLLVLYFAVLRDVAIRLRKVDPQQITPDLCEKLINGSSDGVFAFDRQVRITEWNPGMESITGFKREDVLGRCGYGVIPFLKGTGKDSFIHEVLAGRVMASTAGSHVNPETGKEVYFESQYSPLCATSGEVVGGLATVREITSRERAGALLQESEEKFRNIAHTAADAIILLDEHGKIIFWNKAAEDIFKYSEKEVLGNPFTILLPEACVNAHEEHIARFQEQHMTMYQEQGRAGFALRNGGDEFPVELSLTSWKFGQKKFIGAIIRDVTRDHENRQRLVDHERLATVGSIAAGIVHDFNNALMTIILSCEMLIGEKMDPPAYVELLMMVLHQAQHAATLTEQILDFSRQRQTKMQPLNLTYCLRDLMKLLKRTFPENIEIKLDCGADDCIIDGDSNLLQQALLNLAINARDAMPDGGELRFRTSRLALGLGEPPPFMGMPPGEWVRLDVTDTGEGILSEHLPHVFEPFFTTKEDGKGYGLGLAQVYGIVKQHDGYIDVVSRFNKGTTFMIFMPTLRECQELEMEAVRNVQLKGDGETIMIVEDDESTRWALSETLGFMNFRVITARNSLEAIKIYEEEDIDVVICDKVMPEMSGPELHEALVERDPHVKMIIITGYPLEDHGAGLLERGILAVIKKPMDGRTIFETIMQVLGGEAQKFGSQTDSAENNSVMRVT